MDLIDIQKDLKKVLSAKRYRHSAGVADSARALADKYGANAEKAYIAGWVHDCAKELSLSEMHDIVNEHSLRLDKYVLSSKALLHGPVGSILCETKYGIDDKDIKSAIFYHTTGRTNMTLLEKIIVLADYIEPSRDFPGVSGAKYPLQNHLLSAGDSLCVSNEFAEDEVKISFVCGKVILMETRD